MITYLVGGAVRDKLLKIPVKDRDWVVVGSSVEEMLSKGFKQVGKDFPVFLHPNSKEEYALARTERKTAKGYHGFEFKTDKNVSLEQDLERRDLTINAIAETLDGELIDPFNGKKDLSEGLLRHVSSAFAEDPVRILRIARFAARYHRWGFRVAHSTNKLMRTMVIESEVDHLVPERVWAETEKAMAEEYPYRFFQVLYACGALKVLFPELHTVYEASATKPLHQANQSPSDSIFATLDLISNIETKAHFRFTLFILTLIVKHDVQDTIISQLNQRWKWQNEYKTLIKSCYRHYATVRDIDLNNASELVSFFYQTDAFRNAKHFDNLIYCCNLFAQIQNITSDKVNLELAKKTVAQKTNRLLELKDQCVQIGAKDVFDENMPTPKLEGKALGDAIKQKRINFLQSYLD